MCFGVRKLITLNCKKIIMLVYTGHIMFGRGVIVIILLVWWFVLHSVVVYRFCLACVLWWCCWFRAKLYPFSRIPFYHIAFPSPTQLVQSEKFRLSLFCFSSSFLLYWNMAIVEQDLRLSSYIGHSWQQKFCKHIHCWLLTYLQVVISFIQWYQFKEYHCIWDWRNNNILLQLERSRNAWP